jgi:FkbM family methyltransferase
MYPFTRNQAKLALQKIGFFPVARAAYRMLNSRIREQRSNEILFYRELLKPNSLCFDVGANLGQKAEVFLCCGSRVVILEPNILCQPTLKYLFRRNPKVELVMAAVGSARGWMDLHVHGTESTASARPEWDRRVDRMSAVIKVPVMTLNDLIERYGRPDFVKIDVEGFESEVLKGLSTRVPLLSIEFHSFEMNKTEECLAILQRLGNISVRASDMNCKWLGAKTDKPYDCLRMLQSISAKGDLFVWID